MARNPFTWDRVRIRMTVRLGGKVLYSEGEVEAEAWRDPVVQADALAELKACLVEQVIANLKPHVEIIR